MRVMHISRASLMFCQFLFPLIEAQKKKGHYVCACGSDDSDAQKLRNMGVDVFPHQLRRSLNPFSIIKVIFRIKRILIEQKIDVVVCHTPLGAGVGRIAARLAKTPNIVYFVHGLACVPGRSILTWLVWFCIEKALGKITDAVLVMNNYDERLCRTHHMVKDTDKIYRIPGMGVDLEIYKPYSDEKERLKEELGISKNKKIVLCVAWLIPRKGIFYYLEAAREICARRKDVCFLLAGNGPFMDKLKKSCIKYGLEGNFKILGWRDDINRLMRLADIFVLPTYYFEGLPVSILEAMACGKPVIATRHRGCKDVVVDGKTGFLIPIKQVSALVDKILCLLENEQLRTEMGQAGRRRVEQHFELDYCTEKIVEALEKVREK